MLPPNSASYLGSHVILDIWTKRVDLLKSTKFMESILKDAAIISGATILSSTFHEFGEDCGITGVVILSESHISVHTWPEREYAAVDVFMCGSCDTIAAAEHISKRLEVYRTNTNEILRGVEKT